MILSLKEQMEFYEPSDFIAAKMRLRQIVTILVVLTFLVSTAFLMYMVQLQAQAELVTPTSYRADSGDDQTSIKGEN